MTSKVLSDPISITELSSGGKTTEAEDVTSNLSNAAEGREFMNNFVRVNTIGLDEESVGIKTNFNQL